MKPTIHSLMLTVAIAAYSFGCEPSAPERSGTPAAATPSEPAPSPTKEHGKAGAVPGSHDDWCGEHEVPESLCTRCNPSLAAAFKATGDWCEEHGLPESHCLACNPNQKIERPPAKTGGQ